MKGPEIVGVSVMVGVSVGGGSVGVKVGVAVGGIGEGVTVSVGVGVSDANREESEIWGFSLLVTQKIIAAAPAMIRSAARTKMMVGIFWDLACFLR